MPWPGNNILQYNSGEKSLKLEHIITYDLEALLIKMIDAQIILIRRIQKK